MGEVETSPIGELKDFISSDAFVNCMAEKFEISLERCAYDCGIQKYLDGYEISPHPDVRKKALTYMVNINPNPKAEEADIHTRYLRFKKEWRYVQEYWSGRPDADRCWVPWDWCEVEKQQVANNSMVIFSPGSDTMHAVKANYDHLEYQRTQLYGNLWYKGKDVEIRPEWEDYVIAQRLRYTPKGRFEKLAGRVMARLGLQSKEMKGQSTANTNIPR